MLLTAKGADAGDELELPSKQIYRGRAALSPDGKAPAVGSPICCRRVEIETGKSRAVLQGPWQVDVAWLSNDIVAVLTKGGDWKLELDDPDVVDMPSVKAFPKGTQKHATMRTPGMLHVVDTRRGSDLLVSVHVNAESIEVLQGGRVVVLRREPLNETSWGTCILRHDEGELTNIAKLPIDIGEASDHAGGIRGAAGFEVLGLDVDGPRIAGHRKITDALAVEEQPPPPKARIGVPQSPLRFERVDEERRERITTEQMERFDWIEKHTTQGMALGAHDEADDQNRYFLYDVAGDREIAIEPPLVRKSIGYAWASDRLVAWDDRNVWEIGRDGGRRDLFEAAGPVTAAAPLIDGRTAILHRFKETDGELDVIDAEGRLLACVPLHPFDQLRSLHGGRLLIVGHKNPDSELAQAHVLVVKPEAEPLSVTVGRERDGCLCFVAKPTRFDVAKLMLPLKQVWDVDGVGHLELVTGGVYRVDRFDEIDERFGAVPRLDHRIGSDLFLDQGYIDDRGEWLTDPIWKGADDWQGGRGRVHFSGQGQIALVDESLAVLTPPSFSEIHPFSEEGVASVSVGGERGKGAKCGLIDREGRFVLAPEHEFVGDVADGHCRVQDEARWSLYTERGEKLDGDFQLAGNFAFGLAFATRDGKRGGFVKPDGSWAFEIDIVDSYTFTENGLAAAKLASGKWAFVDREGNVLEDRWDAIFPHNRYPRVGSRP